MGQGYVASVWGKGVERGKGARVCVKGMGQVHGQGHGVGTCSKWQGYGTSPWDKGMGNGMGPVMGQGHTGQGHATMTWDKGC